MRVSPLLQTMKPFGVGRDDVLWFYRNGYGRLDLEVAKAWARGWVGLGEGSDFGGWGGAIGGFVEGFFDGAADEVA